jgi:hypothetical protein
VRSGNLAKVSKRRWECRDQYEARRSSGGNYETSKVQCPLSTAQGRLRCADVMGAGGWAKASARCQWHWRRGSSRRGEGEGEGESEGERWRGVRAREREARRMKAVAAVVAGWRRRAWTRRRRWNEWKMGGVDGGGWHRGAGARSERRRQQE